MLRKVLRGVCMAISLKTRRKKNYRILETILKSIKRGWLRGCRKMKIGRKP
jgi:hypothetical protein